MRYARIIKAVSLSYLDGEQACLDYLRTTSCHAPLILHDRKDVYKLKTVSKNNLFDFVWMEYRFVYEIEDAYPNPDIDW